MTGTAYISKVILRYVITQAYLMNSLVGTTSQKFRITYSHPTCRLEALTCRKAVKLYRTELGKIYATQTPVYF
jgi:hypothetical protein